MVSTQSTRKLCTLVAMRLNNNSADNIGTNTLTKGMEINVVQRNRDSILTNSASRADVLGDMDGQHMLQDKWRENEGNRRGADENELRRQSPRLDLEPAIPANLHLGFNTLKNKKANQDKYPFEESQSLSPATQTCSS
jgi:hypothetical protein